MQSPTSCSALFSTCFLQPWNMPPPRQGPGRPAGSAPDVHRAQGTRVSDPLPLAWRRAQRSEGESRPPAHRARLLSWVTPALLGTFSPPCLPFTASPPPTPRREGVCFCFPLLILQWISQGTPRDQAWALKAKEESGGIQKSLSSQCLLSSPRP